MDIHRIARILQNREQVIRETVLDKAHKNKIILYGARGFNLQLPKHLRKKTTDYDLLSKKPKKTAKEIAETLSRRLEGKINIEKAQHKGTYKIKINGEPIIDVTQIKHIPKTKKVWGTRVKSLKSIKTSTQRIVKKHSTEYRREKDIGTLDRIKKIEDMEKRFSF